MRANIFGNSSIWVSKIAEFDAAIVRWKNCRKIHPKSYQRKFFPTIINKKSIFLQFFMVNFIAFQRLFERTQNQHLWVPPPVLQKVALPLICYETNRCFDRRNNRLIDRCINHCVLQTTMCISLIWCNSCNHVDISVTHHIWASGNHSTFCPFNT